jgi:predicted phosphodiesterase
VAGDPANDDPANDDPASDDPAPGGRRLLRAAAAVAVAVAAAAAALLTLADVQADVGPVQTRLSVVLSPAGGSEVLVPPVGQLSMATHTGPLRLHADVESVDIEAVGDMIRGGTPVPTVTAVTEDIQAGLTRLAVRGVLVALAAAALACALVFRRPGEVVVGTVGAAVALAVSGGLAAATFDSEALEEPQFEGLLAQAPALVGGVAEARTAVDAYAARVSELTANVAQLYGALGALPQGPGPDATAVLWVSDVHNNPAAYDVMARLVEQFDVQVVVDTGDSTDLGSAPENVVLARVGRVGVPYLWVRGNHDSDVTQQYLERIDAVTVLDGPEVVEVAGLRFAGVGDPRYTPVKRVTEARGTAREQLVAAGERLSDGLSRQFSEVDVVLVHEPPMAEPLHGQVPLVLDGHVHERREQRVDGTLELTQGSSGGAGLRMFDDGESARPLEMSILYFDPDDRSLVAVDEITVAGLGQELVTFQRRSAPSLAPEEEAPRPEATPAPSTTGTAGTPASTAARPARPACPVGVTPCAA